MFPAAHVLHWWRQRVRVPVDVRVPGPCIQASVGNLVKLYRAWDRTLEFWFLNEESLVGITSSACADYVPALCTHRPSLLPIECPGEGYGSAYA